MDVSDGLVQDAGHIAAASGVGLTLDLHSIPLSRSFLAERGRGEGARVSAVTAGDDYQILFTAPPKMAKAILSAAAHTNTRVTRIGSARNGQGVTVHNDTGGTVRIPAGGYTHF
jgi:thiamine-monophosphate kinase